MILRELRNIDLLNLQKASRAFWLTDSKLYLYYIHRDFPWFNEFEQVKQLDETYHIEVEAARSSEVAIEKQIHLRTADPFWIEHYAALEKLAKGRVAPVRTTNWRQLYKNLHYAKRDIKGVKNRARIWEVAEKIVERIVELRKVVQVEWDEHREMMLLPAIPSDEERDHGIWRDEQECRRCER